MVLTGHWCDFYKWNNKLLRNLPLCTCLWINYGSISQRDALSSYKFGRCFENRLYSSILSTKNRFKFARDSRRLLIPRVRVVNKAKRLEWLSGNFLSVMHSWCHTLPYRRAMRRRTLLVGDVFFGTRVCAHCLHFAINVLLAGLVHRPWMADEIKSVFGFDRISKYIHSVTDDSQFAFFLVLTRLWCN